MARGRKERNEAKLKEILQDAQGNLVYTGKLWCIEDSKEAGSGKKQRALLIVGAVFLAVVVVGSGCIDAKNAMGAFYVVLPYIGEVSAMFAVFWSMAQITYTSEGIRTYVLEKAKARIPAACRILTISALIGLLCSSIYLIRNGAGDKTAEGIAYLMLKIAAAALSEWYRRLFKSTDWTVC